MVYDKETYQLWWEYLKRSQNYKFFCAAMFSVSAYDLETVFLEMILKIENDETFMKLCSLCSLCSLWTQYQEFGDTYHTSFDDWWAKRNPVKVIEDVSKIYKQETFFFLQHLKHFHKVPITSEEIYGKLIGEYLESYPYGDYLFLKVNASAQDKDIRNAVSKAVKTRKKKYTGQLKSLEKYLLVYDGWKAGKPDDEIASAVFEHEKRSTGIIYMQPRTDQRGNKQPMTEKEVSDYLRNYNRFANQIIKNVEMGNFPGKFRK